jgi:hypothetical protein
MNTFRETEIEALGVSPEEALEYAVIKLDVFDLAWNLENLLGQMVTIQKVEEEEPDEDLAADVRAIVVKSVAV